MKQSLNDLSTIDYYLTIFNQKESKIANRGVKVTDGSTPKKINSWRQAYKLDPSETILDPLFLLSYSNLWKKT